MWQYIHTCYKLRTYEENDWNLVVAHNRAGNPKPAESSQLGGEEKADSVQSCRES